MGMRIIDIARDALTAAIWAAKDTDDGIARVFKAQKVFSKALERDRSQVKVTNWSARNA